MPTTPPVVLSIAGYDPSSGAGITADIKTFAALGVFGTSCITALTVQSTQGVKRVKALPADWVWETLGHLLADITPVAVKIGMLGSGEVAKAIADVLEERKLPNVVLDPILRSSSGAALLDPVGKAVLVDRLLPLADVITPNVQEAATLSGMQIGDFESMRAAALELHHMGAKNVVITGGDLPQAQDLTSLKNGTRRDVSLLSGEHIHTECTHGTGCAFSSALAANLALGNGMKSAISAAKDYVTGALKNAYPLGKGVGPVNHLHGTGRKLL